MDVVWYVTVAVSLGVVLWAGVALIDVVRRRKGSGSWVADDRAGLAAGTSVAPAFVLGTWLVLWLAGYLYFRSTGDVDLLQGRYALLCIPALLSLPVLVLRRLVPQLPSAVPVTVLLVSVWTLQVAGVAVVSTRFYG